MENDILQDTFDFLSYEITERLTRFILHLEEIEIQFYIEKPKTGTQHNLIHNYKESLLIMLKMSILCFKNSKTTENRIQDHFKLQKDILSAINELHVTWLSILPRPSEPIELTRFGRVIFKQIVMLTSPDNQEEIVLSINENLGEEISRNPLTPFVNATLHPLIESFNEIFNYSFPIESSLKPSHITIPRVDASNTFRWPSLIHEMAHSLMRNEIFEEQNIQHDYYAEIINKDIVFQFLIKNLNLNQDAAEKSLEHWLTECWCDLFACILIGPSFYFSQYLVFLNAPKNDNIIHPPATFRLLLIKTILSHRFASLYEQINADYFINCEILLDTMQNDELNWKTDDGRLTYIFSSFKNYFINHFFTTSNSSLQVGKDEELNAKLIEIVNKYVSINPCVISHLMSQLKDGLPIPSIKSRNTEGEYEEIPTYVQEIFLTSWMSRFEMIKEKTLDILLKYDNVIDIEEFFNESVRKLIERHDQAILKSIQVSEWFDFFIKEKARPNPIVIWEPELLSQNKDQIQEIDRRGILVDFEIKELIFNNKMQFIPLMNVEQQIGTTSIDVRLGASFQLFFPDQYGIIDFTENNGSNSYNKLSRRVNLDFIEGLTITPGQFLLGHSMEYIKLPNNICGNIEGRSSFARLGIEIHMTAGFIDPGFEGVITFEIYNAGSTAVKLYPGLRIGQIRLERTTTPKKLYKDRHSVKYKGLLEHNISRQNKDIEVELIRNHK